MLALLCALLACTRPDPTPEPVGPGPDDPVDTDAPTDTGPVEDPVVFTATPAGDACLTLSWRIRGGDTQPEAYIFGVGLVEALCDNDVGCRTTTCVARGATHEWTLRVTHLDGSLTHVGAELQVPSMPAPSIEVTSTVAPLATTPTTVIVDVLDPGTHTLSWDASGIPEAEFVRLKSPSSGLGPGTPRDLVGQVQVGPDALRFVGTQSWTLSACRQPPDSPLDFCSEPRPMSLRVEPGWLEGPRRIQVDGAVGHTVSWATAGNLFYVESADLGLAEWTGEHQLTLAPADLRPGVHELTVTACLWDGPQTRCTNRHDGLAPAAGTVAFQPVIFTSKEGTYALPGEIVALVDTGSEVYELTAERGGSVLELVPDGASVQAGDPVFAIITTEQLRQSLAVDDGVVWEARHWSDDFRTATSTSTWPWQYSGQPLDIAVSDAGEMWVDSEFTRRLTQTIGGRSTALTYPLLHRFDDVTQHYEPVRPFANPLSGDSPSASSAAGEKVLIADDGTVWSTQGGKSLHPGGAVPNHSRICRFDPAARDLASTLHDDRHCAYPVPGDGNGVVGLAVHGDRVWFAELPRSTLSWFDVAPAHCEPLLDYDDPVAVANAALQACGAGESADDGCVQSVFLGDGIWPAHIALDPVDASPWVTDALGNWLLHYVPASGELEAFALPPPISEGTFVQALFQGYPWQLRVTQDAVYVGEYSDVSLVRFDRQTREMSEIAVPQATTDLSLHSIDLDGDRLWFTLGNEEYAPLGHTASTIGYVDVADWAQGTPTGVIYTGLDAIVDPAFPQLDVWHASFRGIDASPSGEYLAVASMRRDAMILLSR